MRAGAGNHRVRVTANGFVGEVEFCATALQSQPALIAAVSGDNQVGMVNEELPLPLRVIVTDATGNPVGDVDVDFTVEQGGGTINGASTATIPLIWMAKSLPS